MSATFYLEPRQVTPTVDFKDFNRIRLKYYSIEDGDCQQIKAH